MRTPRTDAPRIVATAVLFMLFGGFAYSLAATIRQYAAIFEKPAAVGPAASIDAYFAPARLASADELRQAVRREFPTTDDILVLVNRSEFAPTDITQLHYATSYLLYPKKVWLSVWCAPPTATACDEGTDETPDAAARRHAVRDVVLFGEANPFPRARRHELTTALSLVHLR